MTESSTQPLLSVVTVCLNAEKHLAEAMASVSEQSYSDYEYIVVDGGSSDGSVGIIKTAEGDFDGRLRWSSEPDEGLYDAMNRGLKRAHGTFIAYLGADDRLGPGALEVVARTIESDSTVDIVCGATRVIGPHGDWHEPPGVLVRRGMPQRAPARHQSIFVRTENLRAVGGFDTRYRIAADYDAYLKLQDGGVHQRLVSQTLSEFRLGGASSRDALATARDYRDIRIAHGASPAVERVVMWKSATAATLHAAGMRARYLTKHDDV